MKTERFKLSIFFMSKILSPDQEGKYILSQESKPGSRTNLTHSLAWSFWSPSIFFPSYSVNNRFLCPLAKTNHCATPLSTTTSYPFTLKVSCVASLCTQFYCWGVVVTHQPLHNVHWLLLHLMQKYEINQLFLNSGQIDPLNIYLYLHVTLF